jgi:hypothetical protein
MDDQLKKAFMRVIDLHYRAVETDARLGLSDDDDKWVALDKKAKQFWIDYYQAETAFKELLERCTLQ